ncbi:hypothetical protein FRC14_007244 [Serendipita sp. 396]|nr:hypothetical protein FRC14_007244 [Serendipita sp. 396]KAG8777614.1 hypothetical protein FRC15_011234 [Serendipita sp. 397]KAG8818302.1 hypothetical protein FRC18_000157 [Serendipita sp. 400]KAG8863242.1 hypothetical protein FRC20_010818 [Serendipita sp. 405]
MNSLTSPSSPHDDQPIINEDVEMDNDHDGEDQLVDDEDGAMAGPPYSEHSPNSLTFSSHRDTSPSDSKSGARRRRPQDGPTPSQNTLDKSARKREQREREKEQQKQLLNRLIDIFEAGGGTCAVQQGQKKFPWVDLPAALIRIGCYFAGWPEKCLPKMSDKHPDRIDASTGPSQWSLKQKRAMEAQIHKGAVKVLPRPENRAVIFEIVDDFGNVKDSTVEFSENWVRNKLLGLGAVAQSPAQHPSTYPIYASEPYHMPPALTPEVEYSPPPPRSLALPPIRSNVEYHERLDLPSMASISGLHTPEDGSRSPSPLSNFSDGRSYPSTLHPNGRPFHYSSSRGAYPASRSQDDFFPLRGRILTLEHGLPRTTSSLRSTSRPKSTHLHHPYSMGSSSISSIRSRPPSPSLMHPQSHSRSHSAAASDTTMYPSAPPRSATSTTSNGSQTRFPSHVPDVPHSVVAWDAHSRGWILKVQHESGIRRLPCRDGGIVCWNKDLDEWEYRPAQPEVGKAIWNRESGKWELLLPSDHEIDEFLSSGRLARHALFPTHSPALDGTCWFDSERLYTWVFSVTPEAESQLPVTPCIIIWSVDRKQWTLLSESPDGADVVWSHEDQSWHFNMQATPSSNKSELRPLSTTSPRPSSAPHPNTLPPMKFHTTIASPIQSPRSAVPRPMSTSGSSF